MCAGSPGACGPFLLGDLTIECALRGASVAGLQARRSSVLTFWLDQNSGGRSVGFVGTRR